MGDSAVAAQGVVGMPETYESQIFNDAWGQGENESGEDDELDKVDRSLPMDVHIPLDMKGELVSFWEVRKWKEPTQGDLNKLKNRINEEWIRPLNLKQQDIVKASGLGAPYVCYLLKDPNSPNMNKRRKIEAWSVLTELFRKYDANIITKEDFMRLRNFRIAQRFQGPRQDRSGRNANGNLNRQQQRRRKGKRAVPYGDDEGEEEDDSSQLDDDLTDYNVRRRKRKSDPYGGGQAGQMAYYHDPSGMYGAPPGGPKGYGGYNPMMMSPAGYPNMMPPQFMIPHPWMPAPNNPVWPQRPYMYDRARGRKYNQFNELESTPEGSSFQAPYPPGFPPVLRTIVSLANVIDSPPPVMLQNDKVETPSDDSVVAAGTIGPAAAAAAAATNDGVSGGVGRAKVVKAEHDDWVREKISSLAKPVIVPKSDENQIVFREPNLHCFVFLLDKNSCLLPIGVKINGGPPADLEELRDIKKLRDDAEAQQWLDENRDWDDSLWVLWDIKETGTAVDALFDRWKLDHNLSDEDLAKVAKCFLSQYVYLKDVEIGFQALLPYASPTENFCREVEINCDLLEERIRVKDAFTWDIRASDWDLTALLSNFVSDFQLDSPAISSLFIDLKTTILRYRKDWVTTMLKRLQADDGGDIDASKFLPKTLGFEQPDQVQNE